MARGAIEQPGQFLRVLTTHIAMAVQTPTHVLIIAVRIIHLGDVAVTRLARHAARDVRPMVELHEIGLVVDLDPLHGFFGFPLGNELIYVGLGRRILAG